MNIIETCHKSVVLGSCYEFRQVAAPCNAARARFVVPDTASHYRRSDSVATVVLFSLESVCGCVLVFVNAITLQPSEIPS